MFVDMQNAYDLHLHPYPCLIPRLCNDAEAARAALEAGLAGIMIKCHHESTVSRAKAAEQAVDGQIKVYGGIVLNEYVGGLNPAAVEAALKLGGKEVWMPTIDADSHAKKHGGRGKYDVQKGGKEGDTENPEGIRVMDDNGEFYPAVLEILALIREHNVILGTCHLAQHEIGALVKKAREMGVKKILITHPFFKVPDYTIPQVKELVELGAVAEFGYCTVSPMWQYASIGKVAEAVRELGAENCILISDAGQRHNPMPPEALRIFAQCLYEAGITQAQLDLMLKKTPQYLVEG